MVALGSERGNLGSELNRSIALSRLGVSRSITLSSSVTYSIVDSTSGCSVPWLTNSIIGKIVIPRTTIVR